MTVTFYLDLYFLVNFAMDFMLLSMVRRILKLPKKRSRRILSAACGALWACGLFYMPVFPSWLELVFTWVIGGTMMIALAYGNMRLPELLKTLCTLWMAGAASGGVLMAFTDTMIGNLYGTGVWMSGNISAISLLCGMVGIYFGISACMMWAKAQLQERAHLYEVTLWYQGKKKVLTALWDTGNQLYEPYTHEPVHVITYEACKQLMETVTQVIYIPFQAVGTASGLMPGIRIDKIEVEKEQGQVLVFQRPWIAISKEPLSPENQYEMLLNGKKKNEEKNMEES